MESNTDIQQQYQRRFQALEKYRGRVWRILIDSFFQPVIGKAQSVLDLGAGYGEFIGQINAAYRYAMDLNPWAAPIFCTTGNESQGWVTGIELDCWNGGSAATGMEAVQFVANPAGVR